MSTYTTPALAVPSHVQMLTSAETDALILAAQDVAIDPFTRDGVYSTTRESDRALEQLTTAFMPLIYSVAQSAPSLDTDDAVGFALEEFISCVRRYQVGSALPFRAGLRTILSRRLGEEGRANTVVVVKSNASGRYRQLMESVDWDVTAAYNICATTANGFAPDTFLAVHNALTGPATLSGTDSEAHAYGHGDHIQVDQIATYLTNAAVPDPEDSTVQAELVAYLFDLVTDKQEQILRLAYGFDDLATETVRAATGIHPSESVLSDRQVAQCIGSSQPAVNRQRRAALATMLAALIEDEAV